MPNHSSEVAIIFRASPGVPFSSPSCAGREISVENRYLFSGPGCGRARWIHAHVYAKYKSCQPVDTGTGGP